MSHRSDIQAAFEARDVFAAGMFPLSPATHDLGVRRLFDLATLLLLLDCRPGDKVLDLGAGTGFSTEMLARLGYDVVAIDRNLDALRHNRRRVGFDRSRIEGTVQVVTALAEGLPFAGGSYDGVLGMNVLHHVPDLDRTVAELARVLKPGCRAVFVEPGLDHLEAEETRRAMGEHGEDDRAFDVMRFMEIAKAGGFDQAMLTATLHPPLRLLPIEEINLYLSGRHPRPHLTPSGVMEELHRRHPFAMLVRQGTRAKTSRHPGVLKHVLQVDGIPDAANAGATLHLTAHARNVGDTVWESTPRKRGGFITVGCKLLTADGALLSDTLGRTFLPHDVEPGAAVSVEMLLTLPRELAAGRYALQFDLIDELICWFADTSSVSPTTQTLAVR